MGNYLVRYKAELDFDGRELTRSYLDKQDLNELLEVLPVGFLNSIFFHFVLTGSETSSEYWSVRGIHVEARGKYCWHDGRGNRSDRDEITGNVIQIPIKLYLWMLLIDSCFRKNIQKLDTAIWRSFRRNKIIDILIHLSFSSYKLQDKQYLLL